MVRTSGLKRAKARTSASTGRAKASPIRAVTIEPGLFIIPRLL